MSRRDAYRNASASSVGVFSMDLGDDKYEQHCRWRIKLSAENLDLLLRLPEDEIEQLRDLMAFMDVKDGHLYTDAIRALAKTPKAERQSIVEAIQPIVKQHGALPWIPSVISSLSLAPLCERAALVESALSLEPLRNSTMLGRHIVEVIDTIKLVPPDQRQPFVALVNSKVIAFILSRSSAFNSHSFEFAQKSPEIIKALAAIPGSDREDVLDQSLAIIGSLTELHLTKPSSAMSPKPNCLNYVIFELMLLKAIEIMKAVSMKERRSVLQPCIPLLAKSDFFQSLRIIGTMAKVAAPAKTPVIDQAQSLLSTREGCSPEEVIAALWNVPASDWADLAESADILVSRPPLGKGRRFSQVLLALSRLSTLDRGNIVLNCRTAELSFVDSLDLSRVIEELAAMPAEQRARALETACAYAKSDSRGSSEQARRIAPILKELGGLPAESREAVLCIFEPHFGKQIIDDYLEALKAVAKDPPSEAKDVVEKSVNLCMRQKCRGGFEKTLMAFKSVKPDEREDLLRLLSMFDKGLGGEHYCQVAMALAKVRPASRLQAVECLLSLIDDKHHAEGSKMLDTLAGASSEEIAHITQAVGKVHSGKMDVDQATLAVEVFRAIAQPQREEIIEDARPLFLTPGTGYFANNLAENFKIVEALALASEEDRKDLVRQALRLCSSYVRLRTKKVYFHEDAPGIRMPVHPRPAILRALAGFSSTERIEIVDLVSQFHIRMYGDQYTSLILEEIVSMPREKRGGCLMAKKCGDQQLGVYSAEGAAAAFGRGFEAYAEYLLGLTPTELFRLKIVSAVSRMPEGLKDRLRRHAGLILSRMPGSDLGDFLLHLGASNG